MRVSLLALVVAPLLAASAPDRTLAGLDVSGAFGLPAGWRLLATQGPDVADPTGEEARVPGPVRLCLRTPAGKCDPTLDAALRTPDGPDDIFVEPHQLRDAALVYPRGRAAPPLLLVRAASVRAGDGGQVVTTQVLARRGAGFARVFRQATGTNNNQEVRFVETGPLRGAMISAEPTGDAPFGYWVTVNQLTPAYSYRQVARFRSATRYGDGNPLPVIDSEMPGIEQRLGLWRPGQKPPLPAGPCPKPRLVKGALWCG